MRIDLLSGSAQGLSVNLESSRASNLMPEFADSKNAKSTGMLVATPGLNKLLDIAHDTAIVGSPMRGLFQLPVKAGSALASLIAVAGTRVYRIDPDEAVWAEMGTMSYSAMLLATIDATNLYHVCYMAFNNLYGLLATDSGFAYPYDIAAGTMGAAVVFDATPGAYVGLSDVVYLAGYFIGYTNSSAAGGFQYIYYSTLNSVTAWAALDFFSAESDNSRIRRLMVKDGHLWVFKLESIQIFAPTSDSNNPFAPIATLPYGTLNRECIARIGDRIYWIGNDRQIGGNAVYRTSGASVERISNAYVENLLRSSIGLFATDSLTGFINIAYSSVERGHPLYMLHLNFAKTTIVFDELTGRWHERHWRNPITGELEEELGIVHSDFNGLSIVGDRRTGLDRGQIGAIYEMSESFAGNTIWPDADLTAHTAGVDSLIPRAWVGPHLAGLNHERLFLDSIELEFEIGNADANGQGSDPQVTLEISKDAGHTYGRPRYRKIGKVGKYRTRCQFSGCGSGYDLVPRVTMTDPVAWRLVSAYANVRKGE